MKKVVATILSIFMFIHCVAVSPVIADSDINFNEDFQEYEENEVPKELDLNMSGGNICVKNIPSIDGDENMALFIGNSRDGMYCSASKTFSKIKDENMVLGISFMQNDFKADGTYILEATGETGAFIKIKTINGDIVYETAGDDYIKLVDNYKANRWYKFDVEIDLFNQKANIYTDNKLIYSEAPFLKENRTLNKISSYTNVSPGYYIDNLKISQEKVIDEITIRGINKVSIPSVGSKQYTYKAVTTNKNGVIIDGIDITISAVCPSGVTYTLNGNEITFTVTEAASSNDVIEITAEAENYPKAYKSVVLQNQTLNDISISGPMRITYSPKHNLEKYQYAVSYFDELGNEMEAQACKFELLPGKGLTEVPNEISIDSETGLLTVTGDLAKYSDKQVNVKVSVDNTAISKSYIVTLEKLSVYVADEARQNTIKEYLDNALEWGTDPYRGTPLLAEALEQESRRPFEWRYPSGEKVALSNLATAGNLYRIMDGYSYITGDDKYKDRVREIYQYYLDNYVAENGLIRWGGHCAVDLKTGNITYAPTNIDTHELKNHYPYMEPLFELSSESAEKMIKAVWLNHMTDWRYMEFGRHSSYSKDIDFSLWDEMTQRFVQTDVRLLPTIAMPFREAANDYLDLAITLYAHTGDQTALTHAKHLWGLFARAVWPTTGLGGSTPINANKYEGKYDLPDKWWEYEDYVSNYGNIRYGDRYYNQFRDQMVEEGWLTAEEAEELCLEPYIITNTHGTRNDPFVDVELAKTLRDNGDVAGYTEVMKYIARRLGNYAYYAYDEQTNATKPIFADGRPLTGFTVKRRGYNGLAGKRFTETDCRPDTLFAYCKTYLETMNAKKSGIDFDGEIDNYLKNMWIMIKGNLSAWGIGDFGDTYPGDGEVKYNKNCDYTEYNVVLALTYMYEATDIPEFLEAARDMANRIIKEEYHNGLFGSTDEKYVRLSGDDVEIPYAILYLEAVILGRQDLMPVYKQYAGYWNSDYLYDNGRSVWKIQDLGTVYVESAPKIYITDIIPENTMYVLKPGESASMTYAIEPNDSTSKNVMWVSSNPTVARYDEVEQRLYAISKGKTTITGLSGDKRAKVKVEVIVED